MADLVDRAQARERELLEDALAQQAAKRARSGPSRTFCSDCGDMIPAARRQAVPGCVRCVDCEEIHERRLARP